MRSIYLKNIVPTMVVLLLTLAFIQGCTAASVEVRGLPYDTGSIDGANFTWDFSTFSGFTFPVNKYTNFANNGMGEHLYFEDKGGNPSLGSSDPTASIIDEGELVYYIKQYPDKYKVYSEESNVTKLSFYYTLPMFGKTYCAIDNDATNLAKILYKKKDEDRHVIKVGETWNISGGYSLNLVSVDIEGNKCYFTLDKDGEEIDTGVISVDGTKDDKIFTANATFGDSSEHTSFVTFVDSVFASSGDSFAVFKYTWLLDRDNTIQIESGDEFGEFEVDEALETGIKMSNKDSISLDIDGSTYFTDDWYFMASELGKGTNGGYVIYPALQVNTGEQTTSVAQTASMAEEDSSSEHETIVVVDMAAEDENTADKHQSMATEVQETGVEDSTTTTSQTAPGFTILSGIFLLVFVAFIARKY